MPKKSFKDKEKFFLPLERLTIAEWSPTSHGKPVQVHFMIEIEEADFCVGLRFKGPDTMGEIIKSLIQHRRNVWPEATEDW